MNRLIRHLQRENNLTHDGLKQLFRTLCKETHPDSSGKDGESFIQLKTLYEEAVVILKEKKIPQAIEEEEESQEEIRANLLKLLYVYSVKFRGQYSKGLLEKMIETSCKYDEELYRILLLYKESVFIPFSRLKPQSDFYWTHKLFIQTIPQLGSYFNSGLKYYERICYSYIEELKKRALALENAHFRKIFLFFAKWLSEEMEKEKVIILNG